MSVKYASGRTLASTPLVGGNEFPPNLDPAPLRGSWVIAPDGTMAYSDGSDWYASAPKGSEVMIPPWVAVPEGWFEVSIGLSGALANRKLISNNFNINYVLSDAETWAIVTPSAMFSDSAGTTPVISSPEPVGLLEDSTTPQLDWYQDVSVDRPTWVQKTRTVDGVEKTIDALQFDGLGQTLKVDFPETVTGSMVHFTSSGPYILGVEIPAGTYELSRYQIWDTEEIILLDRSLTSGEAENLITEIGKQRDRLTEPDFGTDWSNAFSDRPEIRSMPSFDFTGVTNMRSAFQNSAAEEWLSGGFLGTAEDVTSFQRTFRSNSLSSIPDGLFDNTVNVNNFTLAFRQNSLSSIPDGLFDNTPNVTTFRETFRQNSLSSIPDGLFDNTPNVTNFTRTFRQNSLSSIPDGLFDNTPNVTTFGDSPYSGTFTENNITTVPAGLFDEQTICTNYRDIFRINDLDATSVDNVLVSILYSADENNLNNGHIGIQSGTNATPTQTGKDAADALRARGWTVNLNGY